jgi:DNA-binding CsgD family transcriptional regulator
MTDRLPDVRSEHHYPSSRTTVSTKESARRSLTPAEARVLAPLPTYRTLSAIGNQIGTGRPTVKTHVAHICRKLGATKRAEAVKLAESAGLLNRR